MVRGTLFDDHLIQLKVVTGTLNAQKASGRNPGICCYVTLGLARWPEHGAPR